VAERETDAAEHVRAQPVLAAPVTIGAKPRDQRDVAEGRLRGLDRGDSLTWSIGRCGRGDAVVPAPQFAAERGQGVQAFDQQWMAKQSALLGSARRAGEELA